MVECEKWLERDKAGSSTASQSAGKADGKKIQSQENIFFMTLGQSASSVCFLSPGGRDKLEGETKPTLGI